MAKLDARSVTIFHSCSSLLIVLISQLRAGSFARGIMWLTQMRASVLASRWSRSSWWCLTIWSELLLSSSWSIPRCSIMTLGFDLSMAVASFSCLHRPTELFAWRHDTSMRLSNTPLSKSLWCQSWIKRTCVLLSLVLVLILPLRSHLIWRVQQLPWLCLIGRPPSNWDWGSFVTTHGFAESSVSLDCFLTPGVAVTCCLGWALWRFAWMLFFFAWILIN